MHNLDMTVALPMQVAKRSRNTWTAAFATCDVGPTDPLGVVPANFMSLKNFDIDRSSTFFCNNPIISMVLYPAPNFCGEKTERREKYKAVKILLIIR